MTKPEEQRERTKDERKKEKKMDGGSRVRVEFID